jgi:predicted nucleic acid-binding protein
MSSILVDTGPLYALADKDDDWHLRTVRFFVDATVVAIAERLKIQRILTTDCRDFSLVRPRHCKEFELLP